jgi:hypothetical protein
MVGADLPNVLVNLILEECVDIDLRLVLKRVDVDLSFGLITLQVSVNVPPDKSGPLLT